MKTAATALLFIALFTPALVAKRREWKDATIVSIVAPLPPYYGTPPTFPSGPRTTLYQVETDDTTYILKAHSSPRNLTLHLRTRIAIDGRTARILDDKAKEIKLSIDRAAPRSQRVSIFHF